MIAQDPLSLVFLACFVFSGGFLVISTLLGGQHHAGHIHLGHLGHLGGHDLHLGGHGGHLGSHVHLGHGAHVGHVGNGATQAASGQAAGDANAAGSSAASAPTPWQSFNNALQGGLNLYSILMFLLVFGLLGYLLHNLTHIGIVLSIVLPAILGVGVGMALGNALFRLFLPGAETELGPESSRLEGRIGTVSMAIREGGIGEVLFTRPGGGRQSLGARSADGQAIPAGAEVVILGSRDGIATVQTWDGFMAEVRAGREPLLEPIDHPS